MFSKRFSTVDVVANVQDVLLWMILTSRLSDVQLIR